MTECNRELIPIFCEIQELSYKHSFMEEKSEAWKETDKRLARLYNQASSIYGHYHQERMEGGYFIKMYNERKEGRDETY